MSNRNIFMCPSGISEQWRLHCAECARRNLSSGVWMQLSQVTWNNGCALVDGVWNFIVNKKRGEVIWSNRASQLWEAQDRVTELPVQFLVGSVWGWSCWKLSPGCSGGHSVIASSANAEVKTHRVNKFSVKGNKEQTPQTRNSQLCICWHGMGWSRCREPVRKVCPLHWVTCVYLLIHQTLDFWQLSNKMSLRNWAPVLKIR